MRGVLTLVGAIQLTLVGAKVLDARRCDRSGACSPIAVSCHVAGMSDKPPTCAVCRRDSPEIDRSDSTPRVRDARSVVLESAMPVHAAMAGVGDSAYSRRWRTSTSAERFPADGAGRWNGRHACDMTQVAGASWPFVGADCPDVCRCDSLIARRCDPTDARRCDPTDACRCDPAYRSSVRS